MVFSILLIVAVAGVAYMQYLQGVFTAAISLGCAVVATLVAFGYYENVVNMMPQNGFADYAGGMALMALFGVTYLALRIVADAAVPGNIAVPLYADKAGAAVFGLAAGVLAAGVFATGAQLMPLGTGVAGYAPFAVQDRTVVVPAAIVGKNRGIDSGTFDELAVDQFKDRANLLLPVDTWTTGLVKTASDGAFAGGQPFGAVHPDLQAEAFGSRVGAEHSQKHVAMNTSKQKVVDVPAVYTLGGTPTALDSEVAALRDKQQSLTFKPSAGDVLLVVRVSIGDPGADKDGLARLTPAAARLVIDDDTYYPIGSMESGTYIALNRLDDLLAVEFSGSARTIDLVYQVPKRAVDTLTKATHGGDTPAFVEVKLFGRVDLAGMKAEDYASAAKTSHVVRKPGSPLIQAIKPPPPART